MSLNRTLIQKRLTLLIRSVITIVLGLFPLGLKAQDTMSVGDGMGAPGEVVEIDISLNSTTSVAALEFVLNFHPTIDVLSDPILGDPLTNHEIIAHNEAISDIDSQNAYRVVIFSRNSDAIPNGVIAKIPFTVLELFTDTSVNITISDIVLATSSGKKSEAVNATGTSGVLTIVIDSFQYNLEDGWNLVSIPRLPVPSETDIVFRNQDIAPLWMWKNAEDTPPRYENMDEIAEKTGYWINFMQPLTEPLVLTGDPLTDNTVELRQGWNIFGVIQDTPRPNHTALISGIWEWDPSTQSYEKAGETLFPGRGYAGYSNSSDPIILFE